FTTYNIYIYGDREVSIRPTANTELELEVAKIDLNVGDQGEIIIKSPYPEAKALISVERGRIFDYQIKEIKGNLYKYSFTVQEDYSPNVYVSVLLVSSKPEIKFGQVEFKINTERKELNIEVKSNKNQYLPGEEVTLNITTKDYQGKPVPAEVSLAVVDLSVLALKGNPKNNPLIFFYNGFPLTVSTASNIKNILVEAPILTKGGGGSSEDALERKKRGVFAETAFWQAVVRTDFSGKAQIKFTLPDNLTTWRAETLGLTKDTMLGVNYLEFVTKKELMVVPLKPRFVVPGDIFYIGGTIFNQSKEKQKLEVKFDSKTLVLEDDKAEKNITIESDKTDTVYFKVRAPGQFESGDHVFTLSAKNNKLEDTVEMSVAVTRNNTYEVTATANYTSDEISKEYVFLPDNIVKDRGELSVKSSATLAVFLSDALNYLLGFPYGCSEQVASRLDAIAIVQKGMNLPNLADKFELEKIKYQNKEYTTAEAVEMGLAELYNNQREDGGFSYWQGGRSDFYLTLHVVDTLYNLSSAGFAINQNSLTRASNYLYGKITTDWEIYKSKDNVILTAYTLFRLPNFTDRYALKQKIIDIANDNLFIQEQISNASLAYLANLVAEDFDAYLKNKIFAVLDNKIEIDSRGAFLGTANNIIWRYYETPIKDTALYLKAQVAAKSDNQILDKVLRWLLNSRSKDGAWGSTNNTITVIDAFTDFLQWKRETESNFSLELLINDETKGKSEFNSGTILDQFRKEFALQDLAFNKNNTIKFSKTNLNNLPNKLYYDISLKYYLPAEQIPPRDEGFSIVGEFYKLDDKENKTPVLKAEVGEVLRSHLQITVSDNRNFVAVEDYIPAGMEIVNLELATEEKSLRLQEKELQGRELHPDFKEIRDDRIFLFKENLGPGVYEFDYYVRALIRGKFTHLPAVVSEMYFPENFGRTNGEYFEIK
ncbi:MAG: alpha-2-macroglobulin family protein, partial [Candidatus Nealsonbacteria bacterium]